MKWIKYQVVQSTNGEEAVLANKKIGYSDENLAIAQKEAYDGYEIVEDTQSFEKEPLGIEFGGTGAKNAENARKNIGAAPAGYGLGDAAIKSFSDKTGLDTLTKSGFYTVTLTNGCFLATNYWFMYGLVTVDAYNDSNCIQTVKSVQSENILQRIRMSEAWGDWEWINPPMTIDVEYRTTERYDGKPVYVKLVNIGELPNTGSKDVVALTNGTNVIDFDVTIYSAETVISKIPHFDTSGKICCTAAYSVASSSIKIVTLVNMSECTAVAKIKYTKG
jgi:hypothetical protein